MVRNLFRSGHLFEREYPDKPLLAVAGVVIDSFDRVLLIRRGREPNKGKWSLPGGLVEVGELLHDALRREVAEETGIFVKPMAIVEVVDRIYKDDDQPNARIQYHYVVIDYWCRVIGGKLKSASDASGAAWATAEEWQASHQYKLDFTAVRVIEKGLQMAQASETP